MTRLQLRGRRGRDRTPSGGGSVGGRGHDDIPNAGRNQHRRNNDQPGVVPPSSPPNAPVLLHLLDEDEILALGLSFVGFPEFRQRVANALNKRRFRSFFGVSPKALSNLYADLCNICPSINVSTFFTAINWLKLYDSEHVLSGRWGMHEETIRNGVRDYVSMIQSLKDLKVRWGGFEDDEIFIVSVDGVHCKIQEVRKDPGAKWYSHKFNAAGVTYELGIAVRSNRLVWIKGPFPASQHDVTTFRSPMDPEQGLKAKIPDGKRAVGDSGYRGEPSKIAITREGDSKAVKHFKARVKSRHETFNARLKSFNVLATAFRHGFEQHQKAFESVCICVQYDIESGHGLFEV
jgi:DDE superfamily endonuclease